MYGPQLACLQCLGMKKRNVPLHKNIVSVNNHIHVLRLRPHLIITLFPRRNPNDNLPPSPIRP
jgi:hypothetical protein